MELNGLLNEDFTLSEIKESLTSKSIVETTKSRQDSDNYISSIFDDYQIHTDDCDDIEYEYVIDLDRKKFIIMTFDCCKDEYTQSHDILSRNIPKFSKVMTKQIDRLINSGQLVVNDTNGTCDIKESIQLEFYFDEIRSN